MAEADQFIVRQATADEVQAARDVTNRSWLVTYPSLIGLEETRALIATKHSVEKFHHQFEIGRDQFLVAVQKDRVVGHVWGFEKDGFYVDRLHVDPNCKRLGIGSELLSACEATLPEKSRFWLDVLKGNDAALTFYLNFGFERGAEVEGLVGVNAIVMEKTVRRPS
ncbi:GNAT family N-acetyltransferase [Pseudahrensia aquimaris]|uniref:GNAT family N-acetyltransferase n=1 Tax=Pseudahrensia aquimaris TaxID=744461 RepID=A0ABW3FIT5_9HYPH